MSRQSLPIQPDTDHDTMRCIVDEEGSLVFVSTALGRALGPGAAELTGTQARGIINLVGQSRTLEDIDSGFFEVALLRKKRDPLVVPARIDRVGAPEGRHFTVIWIDPDNAFKNKADEDIGRVQQNFVLASHTPAPAEAVAHIYQDDAELRHFLNITTDLLSVHHRDMTFARINPAFSRALGYAEQELTTTPFLNLIHLDDIPAVLPVIQDATDAPEQDIVCVEFECRTLCKDGSIKRVEWVLKAAGAYVYAVGRDVTRLRQHESALKRREEQLSETEKIARMGHWYWEIGPGETRESMEWSDEIYSIFGVKKDAFIPTLDNINSLILKRDLGLINRAFRRARLQKKEYEIEFRLRRPGGSVRHIRCEGRCRLNPQTGEVEALYGIMQDITERTFHERALRAAKEAAESAYASKTRFLANMSHELRTPLNAIIGFSEMIQRQLLGPVGNARYLDYIDGIRESGEHLLDLINDILDMSKIEVGKYELYVEELNVGKIIRLALHMVEGRAHEGQVRLISENIPDDIQIHADRRALMQILLNLLSNAVKFTPAGGTVEVCCQRELGGVAIAVIDTGVGIPRDKLSTVTLPFEQAGSELTRGHEGSGLGLAITKDLIELHGGTLDIDSDMGVGTTVTVLLPETVPESQHVRRVTESDAEQEE